MTPTHASASALFHFFKLPWLWLKTIQNYILFARLRVMGPTTYCVVTHSLIRAMIREYLRILLYVRCCRAPKQMIDGSRIPVRNLFVNSSQSAGRWSFTGK
eukprot:2294947-Pleurochrysis_carterae.AAC.6